MAAPGYEIKNIIPPNCLELKTVINMNATILNKVLVEPIQQDFKKIIIYNDQVGFI